MLQAFWVRPKNDKIQHLKKKYVPIIKDAVITSCEINIVAISYLKCLSALCSSYLSDSIRTFICIFGLWYARKNRRRLERRRELHSLQGWKGGRLHCRSWKGPHSDD